MFFKNTKKTPTNGLLVALLLFLGMTCLAEEALIIKRGKILLTNGTVKIINLQDNRELKAAGVHEDDIVKSICGFSVTDTSSWQTGDRKLGSSTDCEIKVVRNAMPLTLNFSRGEN